MTMETGKKTILVVEDEDYLRESISLHFRLAGFRVLEAANGKEGLALWQEKRGEIELIVSDFTMPEMNGEKMFREMLALDSAVKAVFFTSTSEENEKNLLALGAKALVKKPCLPSALIAVIRAITSETL